MCALVKIYYNCLILKWCKSSQNSSLTPGCQSLRCFARFVVLLFICSADSEGRGGVQAPAVCHVEEVKIAPLLSYCYKLVSYPLTIFNINCVWVSKFQVQQVPSHLQIFPPPIIHYHYYHYYHYYPSSLLEWLIVPTFSILLLIFTSACLLFLILNSLKKH